MPLILDYRVFFGEIPDPPPWLGDAEFHLSNRSALLRRNPGHYRQFWPDDPDDLPLIQPVGVELEVP